MIHRENPYIGKIRELLEQTGLFAEEELALAEDYLAGKVERREMGRLAFRDLSGMPVHLARDFEVLFRKMEDRGETGLAGRLAHVLFAAGHSSCAEMIPMGLVFHVNLASRPFQAVERAAIYASKVVRTEHGGMDNVSSATVRNLIWVADGEPGNIREALAYQSESALMDRLFLLGAYFVAGYQEEDLEEGRDAPLLKEDVPLLKEYEGILMESLPGIYSGGVMPAAWEEIAAAIGGGRVDGRIMGLARAGLGTDPVMLRRIGGLSYLNFRLSPRLKSVLKVCFGADTGGMLDQAAFLDWHGDMRKYGGRFDEIFGIDPGGYIEWVARKEKCDILKEQYRRNRESWLEAMTGADFEPYNVMLSVLREEDPEQYAEGVNREATRQKSRIIHALTDLVWESAVNDVRAYLEKGACIETLYPYGDKLLKDGLGQGMEEFLELLCNYRKGFGQDELVSKCGALLILCGELGKYGLALGRYDRMCPEDVGRMFATADSQGLSLWLQVKYYLEIRGRFYDQMGTKQQASFEDAARGVFRGYLEERREEMLAVLREADSAGRCFVLELFSEKPEENKEEILGLTRDKSKAVREKLFDILVQQDGWEEDMTAQLSSRRAADRETAVRVLAKWDRDRYRPLFAEALEREKNGRIRELLIGVLSTRESGGITV